MIIINATCVVSMNVTHIICYNTPNKIGTKLQFSTHPIATAFRQQDLRLKCNASTNYKSRLKISHPRYVLIINPKYFMYIPITESKSGAPVETKS